ncbi:MAG TPA: hypothetical protein VNS09_16055 [Solirubrobacter sp.]|nr:hypothetical protein [Solirubrobacter sp.]
MAVADNIRVLRGGLSANGAAPARAYAVSIDEKGELILPDVPVHDDCVGLAGWLTAVWNLDPAHPITDGRRLGVAGPEGHVELRRAGTDAIRFEPASKLNTPQKMIETLSWCAVPTDGMTPALKGKHVREIVYVVRALCGLGERVTATEEAAGIVTTFLSGAQGVEGYAITGTGPQRYEAASALQRDLDASSGRPIGAPRYLIDAETGAIVIRVSDLQDTARRFIGGSIARGFLDARMAALGWRRLTLDGHAMEGRQRVGNPHARCRVYVGFLSSGEDK